MIFRTTAEFSIAGDTRRIPLIIEYGVVDVDTDHPHVVVSRTIEHYDLGYSEHGIKVSGQWVWDAMSLKAVRNLDELMLAHWRAERGKHEIPKPNQEVVS